MFKSLPVLMFAAAAMAPLGSHAADVRTIIKAGYDVGGDSVVDVVGKSIDANKGAFVGLGASILKDSKDIEVEISFSYKFSRVAAQDADIDWTVLPLDALVFYRLPNFRLGGGLTYRLSPTLKGSKAASGLNAKYDNALGFVLQADYVLDNRFTIGLRYTSVDYKLNSIQASPLIATPAPNPKARGIGVVFSIASF